MTLQFPIIHNVLFHIVTHLKFCHTMAASAPMVFRRKSPLDGATDLPSKIWQQITTISLVSAFIVVCSRKPKNASRRILMGPKHNLVHFKSLLGCLLIKSWFSSQHLYAGKTWRVIPSLPCHLAFHFTFVKWFRFGWHDWWGHSGIYLLWIWSLS